MIAYCGLDCSSCAAYLATREDSDERREETARAWSRMYGADIRPEQIRCNGCRSSGPWFFHCDHCKIRSCASSRSVEHCAACGDYVCERLAGFLRLAPEAGEALERLRGRQGPPPGPFEAT
jgi:hypothetical protein